MDQEGEHQRTTYDASKALADVETEDVGVPREESGGNLFTGQTASGVEVARAWSGLLHGTCEPVPPMARENSKWRIREEESTEAEDRDGPV